MSNNTAPDDVEVSLHTLVFPLDDSGCHRVPTDQLVALQAVAELRKNGLEMNFSFLNYAQSSECRNWQDSSVSYAAGALIVH